MGEDVWVFIPRKELKNIYLDEIGRLFIIEGCRWHFVVPEYVRNNIDKHRVDAETLHEQIFMCIRDIADYQARNDLDKDEKQRKVTWLTEQLTKMKELYNLLKRTKAVLVGDYDEDAIDEMRKDPNYIFVWSLKNFIDAHIDEIPNTLSE